MATIDKFEELNSWKKSREMVNAIYLLTTQEKFSKDFELRNQIRRAAGSVMHNIAEGFDAGTNPEFVRFLKMSRRSASEVQSQLYLALDLDYIQQQELNKVYDLCTEVKKLINGLIGYLNSTPKK